MAGQTAGSVMNLASSFERCGGCGMTVQTQGLGLNTMGMAMTVKVTGMTGLAVAAVDTVQATAYCRSVCCIMTGQTTGGVMNLTGSVKRCGGRGMTVNTKRYRGYRC